MRPMKCRSVPLRNIRTWYWAGAAGLLAVLPLGWAAFTQHKADEFKPVRVVSEFPPIVGAAVRPAREVQDELNPSELVLGVTVGDTSRAYPINMLTGPQREIINDTLGGRAIAATW